MGDLKIKYVWGEYFSSSGRYVDAWRGTMLCVRFKAWMRSPEDNSVMLYPHSVQHAGYVEPRKHSVPVRHIYPR